MKDKRDEGKYVLDQDNYIGILERMWADTYPSTTPHHNDRVRVYSLVMTRPQNREMYQQLAEGITHRSQLEDPMLSIKKYSKI